MELAWNNFLDSCLESFPVRNIFFKLEMSVVAVLKMLLFDYSFTIICVIAICKNFVYAIFFLSVTKVCQSGGHGFLRAPACRSTHCTAYKLFLNKLSLHAEIRFVLFVLSLSFLLLLFWSQELLISHVVIPKTIFLTI
jgi:hypothetical protein